MSSTGVIPESVNRAIDSTQRELGRNKWSQLATRLQVYSFYEYFLKGDKHVKKYKSGTGIQFNAMMDHSESRLVGMMHQDTLQAPDYGKKGFSWWSKRTTNYAIDVQEILMNREPARLFDLVKQQYFGMYIGMIAGLEDDCWGIPTATTDNLSMPGIPYWITTGASNSTPATFTGISAAGFTTNVGSIDPTANTRWRNWYSLYTAVSDTDLVEVMRDGARATNFMSPGVSAPEYKSGEGNCYFTNSAVLNGLARVMRQNNDQLGFDLDPKNGVTTFQRIPIKWVPKLETNTSNPIYGINFEDFEVGVLDGLDMKEFKDDSLTERHTTRAQYLTNVCTLVCRNRRTQQLFATSNFSNP